MQFYLDLIDYFFATDLQFRAIIVDKSQINNEEHEQTYDTFYYKMGIGAVEIFPKFVYPRIIKLDQAYCTTSRRKRMYSLTVAASVK